jgi:two-component system CheB/CheR fusion protein
MSSSRRSSETNQELEALLGYLRQSRGFDFTGYKRNSLTRRINRRMQTVGVESYNDYIDYLEVHPDEFTQLFNTILINVTSFFRDEEAWRYLADTLIPQIISGKRADASIRVWSAGCASGEEAYSLAMLLAEELGMDGFRERVKIYATDVDNDALNSARHARYPDRAIEPVPEELRARYFEQAGGSYVFHKDLRRSVIFGRHDLLQDAPISRLDLLVCRNTLMYFNAEAQRRVLARFHFALNDRGVLFLGRAEMLLTHANLFSPIDLRYRIFSKIARVNPRDRLLVIAEAGETDAASLVSQSMRLLDSGFDAGIHPQVIVDRNDILIHANAMARSTFGMNINDLGHPFRDLELSYRPAELRPYIDHAYNDGAAVRMENIERRLSQDEVQHFDVMLVPLRNNNDDYIGISVTFIDVTSYYDLHARLERSTQDLETANEELQSTNEELETMNDELRRRTLEVDSTNAFLNSILKGLRAGLAVLDTNRDVLAWNSEAFELWGVRDDEVIGKSFFSLDIGLPVDRLIDPINTMLSNYMEAQEVTLEAINRRGRPIQCHISLNPLSGFDTEVAGVILLMEEQDSEDDR